MSNCEKCQGDFVMDKVYETQRQQIKQLQAKNEEHQKHIKLLQECDDTSTQVLFEMDKKIEQLQAEIDRLKCDLDYWEDTWCKWKHVLMMKITEDEWKQVLEGE